MQISEAQHTVAGAYVDLIASALGSGRAVHAQTAIASAARLAGSLLFRSFNLSVGNAQPGTVVLSNEANEEGPTLVSIFAAMLQRFGVDVNPNQLGQGTAKPGGEPELSVVDSLSLIQSDAVRIAEKNGLTLKDAAHAAAIATAFIVKECSRDLGAEAAFDVATYGFIEGCKTVPPSIDAKYEPPAAKKPWFKLW